MAAICFPIVLAGGLLLLARPMPADAAQNWETNAVGRSTRLMVPANGRAGFTAVPSARTGIDFTNRLSVERSLTNHILLNGSGVALGDVNGDGWCDVFFAGLGGGSALYLNLGDWKFTNVTSTAFSVPPDGRAPFEGLDATGAVFADLDGDGKLDLLVNTVGHGTRCFHNDGRGRFNDVTESVGLGGVSGATSLALADIDGDGDLDLYVVNYRSSTVRDELQQRFEIKSVNGRPTVISVNGRPATDPDLVGRFTVDEEGHLTEQGEADVLYRNDGTGHFTAVSFTGGVFRDERGQPLLSPPFDWGLAAMFRDLNGDGAPDLYVCNDLNSPDRIWLNDGRGGFRAIPRTAIRKTSWFSMGVDFGDLNRDGFDDFLVTDMLSRDPVRRQVEAAVRRAGTESFIGSEARPQCARNTLFIGRGDGTFAETAWFAGLAASDWSWSPVLLDVDLDGYEDVLITTGFERDVQDADVAEEIEAIRKRDQLSDAAALQLRRRFPRLDLPNVAFRNRGDLTFSDASHEWGFDHVGISQGMALADLDNDGDLDVVINNQNGPALLLRNESSAPRLALRLRGQPPNTQGIGARIMVTGGPVPQSQEIIAGGRYLSGDDPARVFAAGSMTNRLTVTVAWRSGRQSTLSDVEPNQLVQLVEPAAEPVVPRSRPIAPVSLFTDVSERISHRHVETPFDDFQRQPLLPRSLSQLGPAVCWGDLNGDGVDDLVVGNGRGGKLGIFLNDGKGGFAAGTQELYQRPAVLDHGGILIWPQGTNPPDLLVSFSSYESPQAAAGVRILDLAAGVMRLGGPTLAAAIGPLARADIDGDGEPDLFVGGRVVPGRYPQPAPSALFRGRNGSFVPDAENSQRLAHLGLATAAVFTDLDGDGDPDLVAACEWGPLHLFFNDHGQLIERDMPLEWNSPGTHPASLRELTGWWNGVTAVDLDGDGRLDLVAANWGRNTKYRPEAGTDLRLYYGDFAGHGGVDLVSAYLDSSSGRELPFRTRASLGDVLPFVRERFPTRRAFSLATVSEILGDHLSQAAQVNAATLDSIVLLNRGDHFLVEPLPAEAQFAPAFAVVAADFDGDGNEDVFLSQNFFENDSETDRDDAGFGLLLLGDGRGGLRPLSAGRSGLSIAGEQRGAAAADFDADGRTDLVVTQNNEATRLFRNSGAAPGLRVRLQGPAANPTGIGVQLRLIYAGQRLGPMREVHAGSGYWSQDSPVPVLGRSGRPEALWVRWPLKPAQVLPLPDDALEVVVSAAGSLVKSR